MTFAKPDPAAETDYAMTDIGELKRLHLEIEGLVQGVGFRPFVFRLATELGLTGWVRNTPQGVQTEVQGSARRVAEFLRRLGSEKPPLAAISRQQCVELPLASDNQFVVVHSDRSGHKTAMVLPDIATCPDCLAEVFDPRNRRCRYPFTNCTNCGPRYSIIEALPYDRASTTMRTFAMCAECRAEFENPLDRRFHAQPNACPLCGPHLEFWNPAGEVLATHDDALRAAAGAIRQGHILALKGLGGFLLLADARNKDAVRLLRQRKLREEKPLALLYPSLERVLADCEVSDTERDLLGSPQAPIVLLARKPGSTSDIVDAVAPRNPYLGIMLPYSPLHHLLMAELGFPVVATSGNLSDEPICTDEREALARLGKIADAFLVHDRSIARPVDDSVVRVIRDRAQVLRSARGYAPLAWEVSGSASPCLAVGGHLKNTIALTTDRHIVLSQHIGDLVTPQALDAFHRTVRALSGLYGLRAERVACDAHPDYVSTKFALELGLPVTRVQHHYAHVLACMAEHRLDGPVLGVSWDGTGWGSDGTVWGGEFLRVDGHGFTRAARLRTFRLPGGEQAVREPRRSALGLLYEIFGKRVDSESRLSSPLPFDLQERRVLVRMLARSINSPITSSAGRLFDAVASLLGLCHTTRYEGHAAMMVEFAAHGVTTAESYPFAIINIDSVKVIDWEPMIRTLLDEVEQSALPGLIAARFHNTLAAMIVAVAESIGERQVVLTGGCFQNRLLTERALDRLETSGFTVYWHERIPPNDGGIAVGQVAAAIRENQKGETDVPGHSG